MKQMYVPGRLLVFVLDAWAHGKYTLRPTSKILCLCNTSDAGTKTQLFFNVHLGIIAERQFLVVFVCLAFEQGIICAWIKRALTLNRCLTRDQNPTFFNLSRLLSASQFKLSNNGTLHACAAELNSFASVETCTVQTPTLLNLSRLSTAELMLPSLEVVALL